MGYACPYATGRSKPPACKLMNGAACRHHPYSAKPCPEVIWTRQADGRLRISTLSCLSSDLCQEQARERALQILGADVPVSMEWGPIHPDGQRMSVSVVSTVWRASRAEALLIGKRLTAAHIPFTMEPLAGPRP